MKPGSSTVSPKLIPEAGQECGDFSFQVSTSGSILTDKEVAGESEIQGLGFALVFGSESLNLEKGDEEGRLAIGFTGIVYMVFWFSTD